MSLLKNDIKEKLSIIILCAGEGIRLRKIVRNIPKPLIKIEGLNNISILQHTINNLLNFELNNITVIIGHLGYVIREFLTVLKEKFPDLNNKLVIIDSGTQYKLGPLHSFLAITKDKKIYTLNNCYLILPGDTIFDYSLLKEVFSIFSVNFTLINKYPFIFYRSIGIKPLKKMYNEKRQISNAEFEVFDSKITLKRIIKNKIKDLASNEVVNQIIPIIALNYDNIKEILNLEQCISLKTLWQALNHLILNEKKILCFKVPNEHNFYDIDTKDDLMKQKKKKRTIGAQIN
ncbi:MAG: hypothetical protein JSV62_08795 [Promethearchaeota archaeon]|nr:MAG: hypothetical protein JSV62_08795 [Candidatus Lokiarchaeota archaeon]